MYHISCEKIDDVWFFIALNEANQVVLCSFSTKSHREAISTILNDLPMGSEVKETHPDDYASTLIYALHHLYEGKKLKRNFPLSFENVSSFNRKALEVTMKVPRGKVTSYGEIAKKLGNTKAARAVGRAEAKNPFPLLIPCHRVIKSTLDLGEYGGGKEVKRMLLEREGIVFIGDRVSKKNFWIFKS